MTTSSGNSSGSRQPAVNSASEGELQGVTEIDRKRKRMELNRESARRSRMRKQKRLNDLMSQVTQLRKDNHQILTSINSTTHNFVAVEAENAVLRAQMVELSQSLESLNGIIGYINASSANNGIFESDFGHFNHDNNFGISGPVDGFMNPLNNMMVYLNNQPVLASPDLFQY